MQTLLCARLLFSGTLKGAEEDYSHGLQEEFQRLGIGFCKEESFVMMHVAGMFLFPYFFLVLVTMVFFTA